MNRRTWFAAIAGLFASTKAAPALTPLKDLPDYLTDPYPWFISDFKEFKPVRYGMSIRIPIDHIENDEMVRLNQFL